MIRIKILTVGKLKERWLDEAISEYERRLTPNIEWVIAKDEARLHALISETKTPILLDPAGKSFTSEAFASFVETQGARMTFAIGGSDGFPTTLKANSTLISLSPMTFTHQLTRVVLLEQLYRSFEILRGSPYHK